MTTRPYLADYPQTEEGIAQWGRDRKAYFANLRKKKRESRVVYVDRLVERDTSALEEKLAAMEAAQAKLKEKPETPEPGPPEDFLQHRNEGESLEAFRQRMRQWRSSLHSQMMGAKEGVGVFSDEDRRWLAYLEGIDWLGR